MAALVVIAALVAFSTLRATRTNGIGLSNDSRSYLVAARSITEGGGPVERSAMGLVRPQTHFPPGYPAILALAGGEPRMTTRYLNACLLFASTLLCAGLIFCATQSYGRALLAGSLFACAAGTVESHVFLWSEPPFQLLMLATILFIGLHLRRPSRAWLLLAAVAASAAFMTRLAGVVVVGSAVLSLWIAASGRSHKVLLAESIAFLVIATAPMVTWMAWVSSGTGQMASRTVAYVPVPPNKLTGALDTLSEWLIYHAQPPRLVAMATLLVFELIAWMIWRAGRAILRRRQSVESEESATWLIMPLVYLLAYPMFLAISVPLIDSATPLDRRILYPMHVASILLFCQLVPLGAIWLRGAVVALVGLQAFSGVQFFREARRIGLGYARASFTRSPTIRFVRTLPPNARILSNDFVTIELAGHHDALQLPWIDQKAAATRPSVVRSATARLPWQFASGGYYVRLVRDGEGSPNQLSQAQLESCLKLRRIKKYRDGVVYAIQPAMLPATNAVAATQSGTAESSTQRATTEEPATTKPAPKAAKKPSKPGSSQTHAAKKKSASASSHHREPQG